MNSLRTCLLFSVVSTFALASHALAADVSGTVTFEGIPPSFPPQPVTQDAKTCGPNQPDESVVLGAKKGLANTVVFFKDVPAAKAANATPPADVTIDQIGCRYAPHVSAAQVGAKLVAVNSDPVLHNVRGTAVDTKRPRFNIAMPLKGQKRPLPLEAPGLIQVKCDAGHKWMNAYVHVFDHPHFAVSGADGRFTLKNVPAGTYTLETWHERFGAKTARVVVSDKTPEVRLQYP